MRESVHRVNVRRTSGQIIQWGCQIKSVCGFSGHGCIACCYDPPVAMELEIRTCPTTDVEGKRGDYRKRAFASLSHYGATSPENSD